MSAPRRRTHLVAASLPLVILGVVTAVWGAVSGAGDLRAYGSGAALGGAVVLVLAGLARRHREQTPNQRD